LDSFFINRRETIIALAGRHRSNIEAPANFVALADEVIE
jgi:hypothetical protein